MATPAPLLLLVVSMGCRCLCCQRDSGRWAAASRKPALEGMKGLWGLGHLPFLMFVLKPI